MNIEHIFLPGDQWLYLKLYSGRVFSDQLLGEILYPIFQDLDNTYGVKILFFIRYSDPQDHIRIRFKVKDHGPLLKVLMRTLRPYSDNGVLWNVEIATYRREIERYCPENIEICEKMFSNESKLVVALLNKRTESETYIILAFSLIGYYVDLLLEDPEKRIPFLSANFLEYKVEFNLKKNQFKELNLKYRKLDKGFDTFKLNEYAAKAPEISEFLKNQRILVSTLVQKEKIAGSLIHMFVNRLFHSNSRAMELVMYHHLEKFYRTRKAKGQPIQTNA